MGRAGAPADPESVRVAAACGLLAIAPDLDFVPGILLGQPALFHQGVSHSLACAVAVSGATALAFGALARAGAAPDVPARWRTARLWLLFLAAYATHLGLDLFGPDARAPIGIPLLWPFTEATFLAPATLLPGIQHATSSSVGTEEWISSVLGWENLRALGIELAVLAPFVLLAEWIRRRGTARVSRESA